MYPRYNSVSVLVPLLMKDCVDFFIYIYSAKEDSKIPAVSYRVTQWLQVNNLFLKLIGLLEILAFYHL